MKLLSISLARSLWLGQMSDFNPRGSALYPMLFPFLMDTYKFKKYPGLTDVLDESKGIFFEHGEFKNSEGDILNIKLTLFNFGIMAETSSSTSDADFFLEALLAQLHENFRTLHYSNVIKGKNYLSQMYIHTEKTLEIINPKLKTISEYLEKNIVGFKEPSYQLSGIHYWANPVNAITPLAFGLERQVSIPFSENRYFSSAPLQTDQHLELLKLIEHILGS